MGLCDKKYPFHCSIFWLHCLSLAVVLGALVFVSRIGHDANVASLVMNDLVLESRNSSTSKSFITDEQAVRSSVKAVNTICLGLQVICSLVICAIAVVLVLMFSLLKDVKVQPFKVIRRSLLQDVSLILE